MQFLRQFFYVLFEPIRLLFTSPEKLIATPRKLLGLSLPARVAILVAIFLIVCVVVAGAMLYFNQETFDRPWKVRLPIILILVAVIPVVTYQALRLWLAGEVSAFPDIDRAWQAGLDELERRGIDLAYAPFFLVLGPASERQERALFKASQLDLAISDFPSGTAALHWYAGADGVYVLASDVGCLSKLAALGTELDLKPAAGRVAGKEPFNPRQTAVLGEGVGDEEPLAAGQPAGRAGVSLPDIRGTMEIRQSGMQFEGPGGVAAPARAAQQGPLKLSREEAIERQPQRLAYLCKLIGRARQPLCPVNGVLALLPYSVIQRGAVEGVEVQKAVRSDLNSLARSLRLRCPVTALVVGLEVEPGFHELVRRVGPKRARENRFGKGFHVWDAATPEQLEALCLHACGAFEDWVYSLFNEKDALTTPGNAKLFALLCKIRRLQSRLDGILVNGFAYDPDAKAPGERVLLGGCYFAATGDSEDEQAFVKSVFEKLPDQQEDLEWTPAALDEEARARKLARWVFAVDGLLAAALVALIWLARAPGAK